MKEVIYFSFLSTQQENNYLRLGVKMTLLWHVYVYLLDMPVCTYKIKWTYSNFQKYNWLTSWNYPSKFT